MDPLAAFLRARAWLDQASVGSELTLSVFDGRKHYDTNLRYLGLTQVAGEHWDRRRRTGSQSTTSWSRR